MEDGVGEEVRVGKDGAEGWGEVDEGVGVAGAEGGGAGGEGGAVGVEAELELGEVLDGGDEVADFAGEGGLGGEGRWEEGEVG